MCFSPWMCSTLAQSNMHMDLPQVQLTNPHVRSVLVCNSFLFNLFSFSFLFYLCMGKWIHRFDLHSELEDYLAG